MSEDLYGYISSRGEVVVPPIYYGCAHFFEGVATVSEKCGRVGFIDGLGRVAIAFRYKQFRTGFQSGQCAIDGGYINHDGEWVIRPRFLIAADFSEGLAYVSLDGESFGYIEPIGKFAIQPQFEECGSFREGLAAVCINERWGYIDRTGAVRIPAAFEGNRVTGFSHGLAGVQIDGNWGFVDHEGRIVIKPEFEELRPFVEGHATVRRNGKWGFIRPDGRVVAECRFDKLGRLDGGIAPAQVDGKAGFISSEGQWLIEPQYDLCYPFFGELAVVCHGETYSYVQRDGTVVWTSNTNAGVLYPPPLRV